MKATVVLVALLALAGCSAGMSSPSPLAGTSPAITAADLRTRLFLIADDSMMGRESGSEGAYKTADYVASEFRRLGLEPAGENGTYFQAVPFWNAIPDPRSHIEVDGAPLAMGRDFLPSNLAAMPREFAAAPSRTHVPVFMVGGFFEPFFAGQLRAWNALATQKDSVYIVGPWNHLGLSSGDYPIHGAGGGLDQWPLLLEWLDHTLRGAPLVHLHPGTITTFAPGDSAWRTRLAWPPPSHIVDWHLADAPAAQACSGGTLLAGAAPLSQTTYRYDPSDPNPTRGGASLLSFVFARTNRFTPGPVEQGESCERQDVLTWKSAPLTQGARLLGASSLDLAVRSTAPDTAFVARVILEQGEHAYLVREGAATLSLPTAEDRTPRVYVPGSDAIVHIDFWPIEWNVPAGARFRVDVTSSSFPALHAHANRAGLWAEQTGSDVATQTVQVGDGRSILHLSVE